MKRTEEIRKITVNLPASLLNPLLDEYQCGVTEMLRNLMQKENNRLAWKKFQRLRGKVKFSLTYEQIKEDRE